MSEQNLELLRTVLQLTFHKNLAFFQRKNSELFNEFVNYQPEQWALEMDADGYLNIAGNGQFVYQGDPKEVSQEHMAQFMKKPFSFVYNIDSYDGASYENAMHEHIHPNYMDSLQQLAKPYVTPQQGKDWEPVESYPLVCVTGIGLGYHLESLANSNTEMIVIYEPNRDFFYASLHTIDYEWLFEQFSVNNRGISLVVGQTMKHYLAAIRRVAEFRGFHRLASLPIYRHYESESSVALIEQLEDNNSILYSGYGFCEDDIQSIRNSIISAKKKRTFLRVRHHDDYLKVAKNIFICASGPSLDQSFECIKQHREQALVISCGTSLRALYNHGIKPDFHIEIERTEHIVDWLDQIKDDDFVKDITLVGCHTLSDKVLSRFNHSLLYLKPFDAGGELFKQLAKNVELVELMACNPTVANGAMALSCYLGAENIYLFGVDLGFKDKAYHHSKATAYNDSDFKRTFNREEVPGDRSREANFGGTIRTDEVFDWSRASLESLIDSCPNSRVINCSDGIKINGAEPMFVSEVQTIEPFDRKSYVEWFLADSLFSDFNWQEVVTQVQANNKITGDMVAYLTKEDRVEAAVQSEKALWEFFYLNHIAITKQMDEGNAVCSKLLGGSLNSLQATITSNVFRIPLVRDRLIYINQALSLFVSYFQEMLCFITERIHLVNKKERS
ncbi:6-hydroxymethylpterin diphosphokinase MptE-like protein [Psychrobium sp. 1_MG-2023]|uniref:motility associated factor glycosyltransferase family protein n=1 Tax=Psychrobium sp. 1_MG-2023 TaxID=3062624 RepID=UPI000C34FC81|nr:6-hydroxymethylpterin diphosphokinase MptE-like protein [Psychrobium sp. 1_MG-2023]MDP2559858.1 DUF115 domain-containing protein [Psychrobium sp. 1_MG-2023]PKF59040.1 hypothetical protein CW748_02295 [Alteromonadales bacterium alter-6D02]